MKTKILFPLGLLFVAVFSIVSCGDADKPIPDKPNPDKPSPGGQSEVSSIAIVPTDTLLLIGESGHLDAMITPSDFSGDVSWTSADASIAAVDAKGGVRALKVGKTEIKAKAGGKEAVCPVEVRKDPLTEYLGKVLPLDLLWLRRYIWDYKASPGKLIYRGDKPAFIDCWAQWCGPCKSIAPAVAMWAKQHQGKILFFNAEVMRPSGWNPSPLGEAFQATGIRFGNGLPTFILLAPGEEPIVHYGFPGDKVRDFLSKYGNPNPDPSTD